MDALREIEGLVAFEGRWPGTDAERRAARHLAGRLEELGREAEVEPARVRPNYALTHAIHAGLGVLGSVIAVYQPFIGVLILLFAAVSAFGDLTGSFFLLRRLTSARASQNVFSPEGGDKVGTLVLLAHYDAARTGLVFSRRVSERRATLSRLVRRPIGHFSPLFWSLIAVLACATLRLLGLKGPLTIIQFVATVLLIVSVPLLIDIALSGVSPGASDNASGVATVLRLAERYGGRLEHFDVWVLFPGAEEGFMLGMQEWIRAHRDELDPGRTAFLCVDIAGNGTVRWASKEGFIFPTGYHPSLIQLCEQIAEDDGEDGRFHARGIVSRLASDSFVARHRGFPAIRISCLNAMDYAPNYHQPTDTVDRIDPESLERAFGFCSELVERIDREIGPSLRRGETETPLGEHLPRSAVGA